MKKKAIIKINDEKLLKKLGVKPHSGQLNVIEAIKDEKIRDIVLVCGRRWGKALSIDTPILTTNGWKTMKDIIEGDYVFGEDGIPTKVIQTTEVMENHKCFIVTFSDGYQIISDAEHEWVVEDKSFRKNIVRTPNTSCSVKTKTTEELSKDYIIKRNDGKIEANYSIPTSSPLEYEEKELIISPYVLGAWLGDGTSSGSGFTTDDLEIIDSFKEYGYELKKNKSKNQYSIIKDERGKFINQLRELNVLNNKHIPEIYKTGDIEQRIELLQGLMDTDGYCEINGSCEYCGVNKQLVEDVYDLIISLGIKAVLCECDCKLYGKLIGRKYRINFTTDLPIFKLSRKLKRLFSSKRKSDTKRRFIKSIEEIESVPVKCIMVDNDSHQYLAGRNLIPTHNSFLMAYMAIRRVIIPNKKVWIVAPTTDLTQKVFTYIIQFVGKLYEPGEYEITTKPYPKIRFVNGSLIECKTADNPTSLIGDEVDLLIIDEASRIAPMTYERELAATTMTRKGRTVFISTPRGKNWFYLKYQQIKSSKDGFVYNAPSSDNELNTPEELERIKNTIPEALWRQEYLAQFIDSGTEVFRSDNIKEIINDTYQEPIASHRYVCGVDLGKALDWTVITVIDKQTHCVVYWDRFQKIDWNLQKERIVSVARKYNNAKIIIDATGNGSPIVEMIKREGLTVDAFVFTTSNSRTGKSKMDLIDKLSIFIQEKGVFIPNEPVLLDELSSYAQELTDSGNVKYSAPVGMHDDTVCSLALAVWGLISPKPQQETYSFDFTGRDREIKRDRIKRRKVHR